MAIPLEEEGVELSLLDLTRLGDPEEMAARFLTRREREEYTRLRHPLRRREWLGARVCVKAMLLRRRYVGDPLDCEIMKDARGRPWLSVTGGPSANRVSDCSLSHAGRFACAGASIRADTSVGVDVEEVSPRLLRLAGAVVRDGDSAIRCRPPAEQLAVLWALKEAYAKAMGGGLGSALGDVTCEETAEGRHRVRGEDGREFRAWHVRQEGYVVALCLGPREPGVTRDR